MRNCRIRSKKEKLETIQVKNMADLSVNFAESVSNHKFLDVYGYAGIIEDGI